MKSEVFQGLAALSGVGSIFSAGCAVYTAWRAGLWKREGASKSVLDDIAAAKSAAAEAQRTAISWNESEPAQKMNSAINANTGRIDRIEDKLVNTATKADVAKIEGSIESVSREVRAAAAGIDRIEGYFLEQAIKPQRDHSRHHP